MINGTDRLFPYNFYKDFSFKRYFSVHSLYIFQLLVFEEIGDGKVDYAESNPVEGFYTLYQIHFCFCSFLVVHHFGMVIICYFIGIDFIFWVYRSFQVLWLSGLGSVIAWKYLFNYSQFCKINC